MGQSANVGCSFGNLHLCQNDGTQGSGGLVLSSGTCGGSHSLGRVGKTYSIDSSNEGRCVGSSSFSTAFRATQRSSGETRVLRVVSKRLAEKERLTRELDVLRGLDHPNLCKVLEVWEDHRSICIVLEPVIGCDLLTAVGSSDLTLSELLMAQLVRQLLLGLQQIHAAGLTHEDVQPSNILASPGVLPGQDLRLKLIDYGFASKYALPSSSAAGQASPSSPLQCCTCWAPEQAAASPLSARVSFGDSSVDLWAVGAITFLLMSGHWPIDAPSPSALRKKLRTGLWAFQPADAWNDVSSSAKAFVSAILVNDPSKRPSVSQALAHAFLRPDVAHKGAAQPCARQQELLTCFRRISGNWALQQALANSIATQLSTAQIAAFHRVFSSSEDGTFSFSDLRPKLMTAGVQLPGRLLASLLALDDDRHARISVEDVMLAAALRRRGLEEAVLWAAWTAATSDNATSVNRSEVPSIFEHIGPSLRELFGVTSSEAAELAGCASVDAPGSSSCEGLSEPLNARVTHDELLEWLRRVAATVSPKGLRFSDGSSPDIPLLRLPAPTDAR